MNESECLKVLSSTDTKVYDKAMACDQLGRVGTAKAVPALARLLSDEKLHDYARDGLERIADPAAGKALLDALGTLSGSLKVGVIITLGDRGEEGAVAALAKVAGGSDATAADAALASLGQIASEASANAILEVLAKGDAAAKTSAAKAALLAAQRMGEAEGKKTAGKLREAVAAADVAAHLKSAAN